MSKEEDVPSAKPMVFAKAESAELSADVKVAVRKEHRTGALSYWESPQIYDIERIKIEPSVENLEWAYNNCVIAQTLVHAISGTILGTSGLQLRGDDAAVEHIKEWMKNCIAGGDDVEALIRDILEDNFKYGKSLWVKKHRDPSNEDGGIVLIHVDMKTVIPIVHDLTGWRKWIQRTLISDKLPTSKEAFDKSFDPTMDQMPSEGQSPDQILEVNPPTKPHTAHISDEEAAYFEFFKSSPLAPVLQLIVYKEWLLWFMKEAAKHYATPKPTAKVGTETYHPETAEQYQDVLKDAATSLAQSKDFEAFAYPFDWEVDYKETANMVMPIRNDLEYIDQQIFLALLTSINVFMARGTELSTSRSIENNWLRMIAGFRRRFGVRLEKLFAEVLKADSIEGKVQIHWEFLGEKDRGQIIDGLVNMAKNGVITIQEGRIILRQVIDLPEGELDKAMPIAPAPKPENGDGKEGEKPPEDKTKPPVASPDDKPEAT